MVGVSKVSATDQQDEDIQVEVSVDTGADLYSITVTSDDVVQSVVAVPKRSRASRKASLNGSRLDIERSNRSERNLWMLKDDASAGEIDDSIQRAIDESLNRRADSLRPLSPQRSNRPSVFDGGRNQMRRSATSDSTTTNNSRNFERVPTPKPNQLSPRSPRRCQQERQSLETIVEEAGRVDDGSGHAKNNSNKRGRLMLRKETTNNHDKKQPLVSASLTKAGFRMRPMRGGKRIIPAL